MNVEQAHATVLLHEAVAGLQIKPDGIYVDGTFGRGGHSRLILQQLGPQGRLLALDKDLTAIAAGKEIADPRLQLVHSGFARLESVLQMQGVEFVDGILLDLGVSSPQLDDAQRGFSFRFDAPLDMRMDVSGGQTAAAWLAEVDEQVLGGVIRDYGEERFARKVARAIVVAREKAPICTTKQLADIVAQAVPTREAGKNPATRTFQAIRIYINRELEELKAVLPQCVARLKERGRLAVISFHSLEDRMVKHFMKEMAQGDKLPKSVPIRAAEIPAGKLRIVGKAVSPSKEEVAANPRARSAVLRVAERLGA